jgi:hypothetical protein
MSFIIHSTMESKMDSTRLKKAARLLERRTCLKST